MNDELFIDITDVELTDEAVYEFDDHDDLYFSLPKEKTAEFFKAAHTIPRNDDGDEDDSYVEGDIVVSFYRDEDTGEYADDDYEITLAPVYKNEDGLLDGDFIGLGNSDFTEECLNYFVEEMRKLREVGKKPILI